jgi:hypothetical protein
VALPPHTWCAAPVPTPASVCGDNPIPSPVATAPAAEVLPGFLPISLSNPCPKHTSAVLMPSSTLLIAGETLAGREPLNRHLTVRYQSKIRDIRSRTTELAVLSQQW